MPQSRAGPSSLKHCMCPAWGWFGTAIWLHLCKLHDIYIGFNAFTALHVRLCSSWSTTKRTSATSTSCAPWSLRSRRRMAITSRGFKASFFTFVLRRVLMGNLIATFWRPWKKAGDGKLWDVVEVCCIWMLWGGCLVEATLHNLFFLVFREPSKAKVPFKDIWVGTFWQSAAWQWKLLGEMPIFKVQ